MIYPGYPIISHLNHTAHFFAAIFLCFCISGCSKEEADSYENNKWAMCRFQISGAPVSTQATLPSTLQVYIFQAGILQRKYVDLPIGTDGIVECPLLPNSDMFFLRGSVEGATGLDNLMPGTTQLGDFVNGAKTPQLADNTQPELSFYSKQVSVGPDGTVQGERKVLLEPGVARFSLKVKNNADIKVTKIILENLPKQTTLFKTNNSKPSGHTLTLEFPDGGISNKDNICQTYTHDYGSTSTIVTIYATYNGIPCIRRTIMRYLERGNQYTLTLEDTGTTVKGGFEVEPWANGETTNATDDNRIGLLAFHDGGSVSADTLMLTTTGTFYMSFVAPFDVNMELVGETWLSISGNAYHEEVVGGIKRTDYTLQYGSSLTPGKPVKVKVQSSEAAPPAPQFFYIKRIQ